MHAEAAAVIVVDVAVDAEDLVEPSENPQVPELLSRVINPKSSTKTIMSIIIYLCFTSPYLPRNHQQPHTNSQVPGMHRKHKLL